MFKVVGCGGEVGEGTDVFTVGGGGGGSHLRLSDHRLIRSGDFIRHLPLR